MPIHTAMRLTTAALIAGAAAVASADRPRVIFHVLADDFGWADAGWHRPPGELETPTPRLSALVKEGIELDRLYVHQACTPSRSALLSGRLPVHVQMTLDNPEKQNSGLPRNMTTIGTKLASAGYVTHVVGKWDAGERCGGESGELRGTP
jgi:arylsulfatase B